MPALEKNEPRTPLMTTLTIGQKWRNRTASAQGLPVAQARGIRITILLGLVTLLSTWALAIWPWWCCWTWLLLPFWARGASCARLHVSVALGVGCALFGVLLVQFPVETVVWPRSHPPFGEHPVTVLAGFPWPGVEGCRPPPLAHDRIPFDMGVDALLVNAAAFTALFAGLLRRCKPHSISGLLLPASAFAFLGAMVGGWELVTMFD